jgi:hypothetical protein
MAATCPSGSICSDPYTANVGTNQTNLFFFTSTKVTQDSTGKVNGGTTTLYYSSSPGNYTPAATTSDGGKTWDYLKKTDGSFVLGDDARKSLQEGVLKNNTNTFIKSAAEKSGVPEQQAKTLQLNQNTASSNAPEPGQSGSGETPIDINSSQTNLSNLKISDDPNTRAVRAYPEDRLLKYPITMSGDQDYVKFTMLKYASRGIELSKIAEGSPLGERGGGTRERGSTVVLPIQPSVSDSNVVKWGSDDMNAGQLIAAAAALGTILDGPEGAISALQATKELIGGSSKDIKTAFAAGFADAAAGTKGLLTRVTGGIVNPNMELLFQGPDLRTFNFNFTLSAREPQEAKVIRNIIRFFKQGMSVKRASTALFLKSPHTFEIKYIHKGKDHPWINKIKECALTSCNVNYTPAGNYATYEDGSMTQYDISLSFSELEPIYDDDYGNGGGTGNETEIGY